MAIASFHCAPEFSTERETTDPGSFGERVITLMCKRLAFQADRSDVRGDAYRDACRGGELPANPAPTVATLHAERDRLVAAIDKAVPADKTGDLQAYLTQAEVLGMYDDDTMAKTTASLGKLLDEMGGHDDAMAALARLGGHQGYRAPAQAIGPNDPIMHSAGIDAVLDHTLAAIAPGGPAAAQLDAVTTAVGATMNDASVSAEPVEDRASTIVDELLLTEHDALSEATPTYTVRRDRRGAAVVALVGGAVPAPFVDLDGDLLADLDATGRFVDAAGMPLMIATPFPVAGDTAPRDELGRALDPQGQPIYVYLDVGKTVLGALTHDTKTLTDPVNATAIDFARGASLLLGDRVPAEKTFENGTVLAYTGYDTTKSPALDLVYAYSTLLRDPNFRDMIALTIQLFAPEHQAMTARLAENAIDVARLAEDHVEAQILANAPLWDDLRPILQRIAAKPKLMHDLLESLKLPETKELIKRYRDFMTYKDRFDISADASQSVTGTFATMVDRTQPDSGFNRSIFQRLLMLISDSQVGQCSKANAVVRDPLTSLPLATYQRCGLFQIENLAVFFLQSMVYNKDAQGRIICESNAGAFAGTQTATTAAGCVAIGAGWRPQRKANFNYNWGAVVQSGIAAQGGDAFVESQSTIKGFRTHPTPEALIRVLFLPTMPASIADTTDPILDKDGDLIKEQHAGTLPVWEKNNFFDQTRPMLQAFADAGEEKSFVDIIAVLNKHWSTAASTDTQHTNPAGKNYTFGAGAVTYEPLAIEVMGGDLWPALTESAAELTSITVNGKPFSDVLNNATKFLVTPLPGLTDRLGNTASVTSDGKPVTVLSPWQILADATNAKTARLAAVDPGHLWKDSTRELVDVLFRADKVGDTWTWRNPRTPAVTIAISQWLDARIAAHDAAGDRTAWLATNLPNDMRDKLTHPVFASIVDLLDALAAQPAALAAIGSLLAEVMDETAHPDWFATMRVGNADLVQLSRDDDDLIPLAHMIGAVLPPERGYLNTQLAFLDRMHRADGANVLHDLTARMFEPYDPAGDPGVPTISAIVDGVGDVDRVAPGVDPRWTAADYAATFRAVGAFLQEQMYGLPRFIAIVKGREIQ